MKLLAVLIITTILLSSIKTERSLQAVQKPANNNANNGSSSNKSGSNPKKNNGVSGKVVVNNDKDTVSYSMTIFGQKHSFTWDKWIWGIVFIIVGIPLTFLTISWWKFLRLPIGGIVGFFACNAIEVYIVMPYIEYTNGARIGWIIGYV